MLPNAELDVLVASSAYIYVSTLYTQPQLKRIARVEINMATTKAW